ncbi:MAG: SPASM domain-containing protein, partial [Mariniphaga sp.]|nr:SPASM domain-containing protein [Mariniphaga sp.]
LCVVNAYNVNYPIEVYSFFKSLGAEYISFLPLVERDKCSGTSVTFESVPSKAFGQFLITIFCEWIGKDIGKVKIELFEEAFRKAFNQEHTVCVFKKECGGVPVFEHTGDLYSCDHYVTHDNLLGNINDLHITKMLYSLKQKEFGERKFNTLPNCCLNCEVLEMCYGECPKNRFVKLPDEQYALNYLCAGYKSFFIHCTPFIETITAVWKSQI